MLLLMLLVMVFLFCGWYSSLSCRLELLWRLKFFGSCKFHYQLLHFKYAFNFFPNIVFFFLLFLFFFFHVCCFLVSCIYLFIYLVFIGCSLYLLCNVLMSSSPSMSLNLSKSIYPMLHLLPN